MASAAAFECRARLFFRPQPSCRAKPFAGTETNLGAANSSAQVDHRRGRPQYKEVDQPSPVPMAADPILLVAAKWLGIASGLLILATVAGFLRRWGIRFRLVGITSFTALLAISCLAFSISYTPRVTISGAVVAPVVFDGGADLVIAAAPRDLAPEAIGPTVIQVASNLHGGGRTTAECGCACGPSNRPGRERAGRWCWRRPCGTWAAAASC